MNFIYTFHFISALMLFGLMIYIFQPIVTYLNELFPTTGTYSIAMFFLWSILPAINLLFSGIRLVMAYQQRKTGYY